MALPVFAAEVRRVWEKAQKCLFGVGRKGWLEIEKDKGRRYSLSNKGRRETGLGKPRGAWKAKRNCLNLMWRKESEVEHWGEMLMRYDGR